MAATNSFTGGDSDERRSGLRLERADLTVTEKRIDPRR
jgi:hypothetical protein